MCKKYDASLLNAPQNKRLDELDSLRGLAALSVLFFHFIGMFPETAWWFAPFCYGPLRIFWAGQQAVVFFFILSGFVLSLPFLENKSPLPYPIYAAKRILRVYPAYFFAVAIAMFFREILYTGPLPGLTNGINGLWTNPVTWGAIKSHIILIGSFRNGPPDFNPVIWSLTHEMRISLIFPALAYLVRYKEKISLVLMVVVTALSLVLSYVNDWNMIHFPPQLLQTFGYIGIFIVGALLAKHRNILLQSFSRLSRMMKWLLFGVAVMLYTYVFWLPPLVSMVNPGAAVLLSQRVLWETISTAGICIFILASLSARKLSSFLTAKPLRFLGAISYSLYLYHLICLMVTITLLHALMPLWLIFVIALISSFFVSILSYYLVEIPFIDLGKWLVKRYFVSRQVAVAHEAGEISSR
jgi:peptidoglycan/LPS O-acetylase OafA/YrhL